MQSGQLAYDAGCMSVRRSRQIRDELDVKRDLTRSLAAAASVRSSKNVSFFRHVSSGLASFPKPMESQFSNERQKQKRGDGRTVVRLGGCRRGEPMTCLESPA